MLFSSRRCEEFLSRAQGAVSLQCHAQGLQRVAEVAQTKPKIFALLATLSLPRLLTLLVDFSLYHISGYKWLQVIYGPVTRDHGLPQMVWGVGGGGFA